MLQGKEKEKEEGKSRKKRKKRGWQREAAQATTVAANLRLRTAAIRLPVAVELFVGEGRHVG